MRREETLKRIKEILTTHRIPHAYLFGSFARKERSCKDIDIAIEKPAGKFSLFDLVGIQQELEDSTGKKVDVVIYHSIKPRIKENIKKDLYPLL